MSHEEKPSAIERARHGRRSFAFVVTCSLAAQSLWLTVGGISRLTEPAQTAYWVSLVALFISAALLGVAIAFDSGGMFNSVALLALTVTGCGARLLFGLAVSGDLLLAGYWLSGSFTAAGVIVILLWLALGIDYGVAPPPFGSAPLWKRTRRLR